eukprot:g18989.t1
MVLFAKGGAKWGAAAAIAALAALIALESTHAFGIGAALGLRNAGNVHNPRPSGATSSFLRAGPARGIGTGECSPTSLSTSYVVKPEMARSRASEWRKLRTRGPGFEEKVRRAKADPDLSKKLSNGLWYLNSDEMEEMQQALAMAIYAHSLTANHGGGYDAVKAGVEACLILGELKMGTDALLAAILSGVLSAQRMGFGRAAVTAEDIEQGFGARVARSVENFEHVMRLEEMARQRMSRRAVQDESGVNTSAITDKDTGKQGHHLRDLIISEASDWQVLTLYLAVHMQELRYALGAGASNAEQLARDALEIHAPLAHRLGVHHLSAGLEDLAFEALYPVEYDEIRRSTEARMGVYQEVMETAKSALSAALRKDKTFTSQLAEEVVLQHRIKEPYSMWKKMTRQGRGVDSVYDAVALRAVIKAKRLPGESDHALEERSKQLCYHAMAVAKKMYPTVEGRCKDYVMYPKPNGYQSLHSTHEASVSPGAAAAANGERHTHFELQVRSSSMHHKAEYGHAAHWSYKSDGDAKDEEDEEVEFESETSPDRKTWKSFERPMATGTRRKRSKSVSTAAAVPDSVSSGRELVTWLHLELRQRKVFVFGPDNLIWELDKASATAGNVLGRTHAASIRLIDGGSAGCKTGITLVNGKAVPLHYAFKNGDVLDLDLAMAA